MVEEALKKTPGNPDLEEELSKSRDELGNSLREKEEAEAEQKLSEVQQHHAFFVKEQFEDRQERVTFRKVGGTLFFFLHYTCPSFPIEYPLSKISQHI